jgi:hypothetical protein
MPVTFDDLQVLTSMVGSRAHKLSAVARELNVERTYLYRMMERCDDLLDGLRDGPKGEWREGARFRPPAELRRLARCMAVLTANWYDYPVVAVGMTAGSVVGGLFVRHAKFSGRYRIASGVQTEEALRGLANDAFDLAIVQHGAAVAWNDTAVALGVDVGALSHRTLLPWRAVVARTRCAKSLSRDAIDWHSGSFAQRLSDHVGRKGHSLDSGGRKRSARSYADALLMARHGHPVEFVIPDIYLANADEEVIELRGTNVVGALVGVYRSAEESRLSEFLDPVVWNR